MEYKSAEEYIKSDKFKKFHKDRRAAKKEVASKMKAKPHPIHGGKDTRDSFMKALDAHKADRRFW